MPGDDPFRHHPGLRDLIADPETSFHRDISHAKVRKLLENQGLPPFPFTPDEVRERGRRETLNRIASGDVWVFAYGSLMWDPAIHVAEIRRASVQGYARHFILKDVYGGRGTEEKPGLMVALDTAKGKNCNGLAFRIAPEIAEHETEILWQRERLGPAYIEAIVDVETAQGPVRAITFVADHSAVAVDRSLTFETQVEYCATGTGFLGTSLEYAQNIRAQFRALRIEDPDLDRLVDAAERRAADLGA